MFIKLAQSSIKAMF
ncbi:TPA: hypothetical protein ACSXTI_000903 [Escherichia coli]|nr:hypothetical protein [Escherichia coli]ELF2682249.1 hypothetical protein [Escherichia coli]ELW7856592.1 hypothetical protein [Escherichia coli]